MSLNREENILMTRQLDWMYFVNEETFLPMKYERNGNIDGVIQWENHLLLQIDTSE